MMFWNVLSLRIILSEWKADLQKRLDIPFVNICMKWGLACTFWMNLYRLPGKIISEWYPKSGIASR